MNLLGAHAPSRYQFTETSVEVRADLQMSSLVIWPGRLGDQSRDFVFTCKREGDRIGKIKAIMRLEDTLAETLVNTPVRAEATAGSQLESQLENEQYQAFHNFFHAVSIWRQRMSRKET